jgi:dipeptidyl aminopeptidase/acylaminoacyl peptidase
LRRALGGTPDVFPILAGQTFVRTINGRQTLFAQTYRFENAGYEGASLYQVDLDTGRGRKVFEWDRRTPDFVAGPDGLPIAQADYYADTGRWVLKLRRGVGWPEAWSTTAPLDQPYLDGMGTAENTVIVHAARDGQPPRFHQVDVTTGEWSDLPFEGDPDVLIRHPQTQLVIGAAYTKGDEVQRVFLDPNGPRARAARSIAAAFPGRHPEVVAASDTLRQLVVQTWGDEDPGSFHMVDLDARSASELGSMYPTVTAVGEVRPIRYAAADGMMIPGYLTLPPGKSDAKGLPLVALVHGGPAARDSFGFDWWAQAMAAQGYAVLQANYRGSDGLGDAHREAGYGEWGAKMQTDVSDGVRWLASEGIVDPARVCIVGASYGGYAAMAGPTLDTGVYRCAVAVAGVSDLRTMVSWAGGGSGGRNPTVRYWTRFMGDDMDNRSPRRFADRTDAPMLLIHGIDDTVVPFEQSRIMGDALRAAGKPYELIRLNGEDHWLSRGETRTRMLAETLRWLETYNPAQP